MLEKEAGRGLSYCANLYHYCYREQKDHLHYCAKFALLLQITPLRGWKRRNRRSSLWLSIHIDETFILTL